MEMPEFLTEVSFWIKFIPVFALFVIAPIFLLDFTNSMTFFRKVLFMLGGAVAVALALNGKTIKYRRSQR